MGVAVPLTLLPARGTLLLLMGCLFQTLYDGFCLVLLLLILSNLQLSFEGLLLF